MTVAEEKKPKVFEGRFRADGLRFGIVVARFNSFITERLLEGAIDAIRRHGGDPADIDVYWVPGAYEIPMTAARIAEKKRDQYDALICLGCVIRGGTSHYEHVCSEALKGVADVARSSGLPVGTGIITTDTIEQAIERAGTKMGNKGAEAALAVIELARLYEEASLT